MNFTIQNNIIKWVLINRRGCKHYDIEYEGNKKKREQFVELTLKLKAKQKLLSDIKTEKCYF